MAWPVEVLVAVEFADMAKYIQTLESSSGPVQDLLTRWAFRVRTYLTERFVAEAWGEWPPLKYREGAILRDTGLLLAALDPSSPGPGSEEIREGSLIAVGYGGGAEHGDDGVSIADIAYWHQVGAGNLPVRQTVVTPDQETIQGMMADMKELLGGY